MSRNSRHSFKINRKLQRIIKLGPIGWIVFFEQKNPAGAGTRFFKIDGACKGNKLFRHPFAPGSDKSLRDDEALLVLEDKREVTLEKPGAPVDFRLRAIAAA